MKLVTIAILVILLLLTGSVPLACGSGNNANSNHYTYWFTDPPEVFHTNDVERARRELPFALTLPAYLPNDIITPPYMIDGPVKGTCPEDKAWVRVTYHTNAGGHGAIYIEESSGPINVYPPPDSESTYLDIDGIRVLECEIMSPVISSAGTEYIRGLSYIWNKNGLHFDVEIYVYGRDEARRTVESMIKPI